VADFDHDDYSDVFEADPPAFDPAGASDADLAAYVEGRPPVDLEAEAQRKLAEKQARELEEFRQSIREDMEAKGFDTETMTWRKPEPPAPPAEPRLAMEQLSEAGFARLMEARDAMRAGLANPLETGIDDPAFVSEVLGGFGPGGSQADVEGEEASDERWGDSFFMGELID
jgi:hypothetical protein